MKKLKIFLSSAMSGELDKERELIRFLFSNDHTLSEFYELFAIEDHASPQAIEIAYCSEVSDSDIVLFIFNKYLREAVLKEYQTARESKKIIFIYLKQTNERDIQLKEFIVNEIYNFNPGTFTDPQNVCKKIKNDLLNDLLRIYTKELKIITEEDNVVYSRKTTLSPHSTYRFFRLEYLLEIEKEDEFKNLSTAQLITLSSLAVENNANYKLGLILLELALIKEPDNWILHNNRGLILETMGLDKSALFSYHKAIELNENNDTTYYNLGGVYFRLAMYDEAIKHYKISLDYNPEKKNAISQIAACYLKIERPEEALDWAKRAFELQKDEATIINLISAYILNKQYDKAMDTLKLIEESKYNYDDIYSFILYTKGSYNETIKIIDNLYEKGYLEFEGAIRKFHSLIELGFEKESFLWFSKIEKTYPITAYDYNDLGYKYIEKLGKSEYANYFFRKAIGLDSSLLNSWQNLQYNLAQLDEFISCNDVCDETLKLFPFDQKTIQNKIMVLAEIGQFSEVMKFTIEKSISLIGNNADEKQIKDLVELSYKNAGVDMKKFDELFKRMYELNKLINKTNPKN